MRKLLVTQTDEEEFTIEIPDDAKVTFGPWSPATMARGDRSGTLRIYKGSKATENVMAVFGGVAGFRDLSLDYQPLGKPPRVEVKEHVDWSDLEEVEKEELAKRVTRMIVDKTVEGF